MSVDLNVARKAWFGAAKAAGLDEDGRRAVQMKVCGKDSAAAMDITEFNACINQVQGRSTIGPAFKKSAKPRVRKIYAQWGDLVKSGKINNGSKPALRAFCARQCGLKDRAAIDPEFLTSNQADSVIEALKAMQQRTANGRA